MKDQLVKSPTIVNIIEMQTSLQHISSPSVMYDKLTGLLAI